MIEVTAIVEAGTLAGNLVSCKDVIGKTVSEISNVNTIVVSFKDENDVPITDIEKIVLDITNVVTGNITRHEITPTQRYQGGFYHYGTQGLPTNIGFIDNKMVAGRAYAANENIIEQVDEIRLISITYAGVTTERIVPTLQ